MLTELAYAPLIALGLAPSLAFRALARGKVYEVARAPFRPVALVLGAKLFGPRQPTTMLLHRLETAKALVDRQAAGKLLLSGLGGTEADEVDAMRAWLVEHGGGEDRLLLDSRGARTLLSMTRARSVFGLSEISIVTNPFHLPRALFLARHAGLDAVGVAARGAQAISGTTRLKNQTREAVASLRAVWDCVG